MIQRPLRCKFSFLCSPLFSTTFLYICNFIFITNVCGFYKLTYTSSSNRSTLSCYTASFFVRGCYHLMKPRPDDYLDLETLATRGPSSTNFKNLCRNISFRYSYIRSRMCNCFWIVSSSSYLCMRMYIIFSLFGERSIFPSLGKYRLNLESFLLDFLAYSNCRVL